MPRHKHHHHRSSSSSSPSSNIKVCNLNSKDWFEIKIPERKCYPQRKSDYDRVLGINYGAANSDRQLILCKKNSNIGPGGLSGWGKK